MRVDTCSQDHRTSTQIQSAATAKTEVPQAGGFFWWTHLDSNQGSAGWRIAGTAEFLGLNDEEAATVELKPELANAVKDKRARGKLTQMQPGKFARVEPSSEDRGFGRLSATLHYYEAVRSMVLR
jgi:hypothetical protein